jgi:hypothetical protein
MTPLRQYGVNKSPVHVCFDSGWSRAVAGKLPIEAAQCLYHQLVIRVAQKGRIESGELSPGETVEIEPLRIGKTCLVEAAFAKNPYDPSIDVFVLVAPLLLVVGAPRPSPNSRDAGTTPNQDPFLRRYRPLLRVTASRLRPVSDRLRHPGIRAGSGRSFCARPVNRPAAFGRGCHRQANSIE